MTAIEKLPLTWRAGEGTLVLAGGTTGNWLHTEAIDRAAIAALRRDGPCVFLPAAGCAPDYGETFMARYAELGGRDARVVPVHDRASAQDGANARLLESAALVYIGGGETPQLLGTMAGSAALDAMARAYGAGAVIAGMSAGAIALAARGLSIDPRIGLLKGWGWAPDLIVAPHYTPERSDELAAAVRRYPASIGLGLPEHVAIVLAPNGAIKARGEGEIAVIAGAASRASQR